MFRKSYQLCPYIYPNISLYHLTYTIPLKTYIGIDFSDGIISKEVCHKKKYEFDVYRNSDQFLYERCRQLQRYNYEYLDALNYQNDILDMFQTVLLAFFDL